jgi:two-component system, repressor protein LuxO
MALGQPRTEPVDVFIVDADPTQCRALAGAIADHSVGRFAPKICNNPDEALGVARNGSSAIVIADLDTIGGAERLGDMAGPTLSLIATSSQGSLNTAVAAVKAGAVDFFPKPIGATALIGRLEAAVATWSRQPEQTRSSRLEAQKPPTASKFGGFIGSSAVMREIYDQIGHMAPSHAPVFITGESGAGKELAAEAIHAHAGADGRPFIAINCSAIPKDLMESEIFGHVRGAFTGAAENRAGAAELADGGTLFLDEIAEMDISLQAKLLRFVQNGTLQRVGDSKLTSVDVRLVCATNRDPFVEVENGRFRSDLFYRLHVLPIHLPPLRDRSDDILPLARAFLARFSAEEERRFIDFHPSAEEMLLAYPWPGNIRQLQNVIRRTVVLHDAVQVSAAMLPETLAGNVGVVPAEADECSPVPDKILTFRSQERRIIEAALAASGGNVPRAAAALEISPATIYRKIKTWTEPAAA